MFPMKTGTVNITQNNPKIILYQSILSSAFHEIGRQVIIDASLLTFHQEAAEFYNKNDENYIVREDIEQFYNFIQNNDESDDELDHKYGIYTDEQREAERKILTEYVWKYHILHEDGICYKLTRLIDCVKSDNHNLDELLENPLYKTIINNSSQYIDNLHNDNINQTINNILDMNSLFNHIDDSYKDLIRKSYDDNNTYIDIAIFEDDSVQCNCNFCIKFFSVVDLECNYNTLNYIQQVMADKFNLL